jgi:hypothetical protein
MSVHTEARFPTVTGETLTGRRFDLPADFEASYNLAFVAFRRRQQADVDTWVPVAEDVEAEFPDVRYYELPVISRLYAPAKAFIDGGMRAGIPDAETRERTITVYTDKDVVRRALDIESEDAIRAFLVDREGVVYWRAAGPRTDAAVDRLREVLASLA